MKVHAELIDGPWDGRVGELEYVDEPQLTIAFNLADKDSTTLFVGSTGIDDDLTAVYVRNPRDKPHKVIVYDDNGRARSETGVRYRYDKDSPCERLFRQADRDALLTAEAHEQVMNTRKLLLQHSERTST
jgi:hypothetical protein